MAINVLQGSQILAVSFSIIIIILNNFYMLNVRPVQCTIQAQIFTMIL